MDGIFGWLIKLLFLAMLGPFLVCLVLQLATGMALALLPWFVVGAILTATVRGLVVGLVIRSRLPSRDGATPFPPGTPPLGAYRVRRPRGRMP